MARGRSSPGTGRNIPNLADPAAYRKALAVEILDKERIAASTEIRKRHRKKAEGDGIVLADLDDLFKMKDMAFSEIEAWFRRKFNALGAVFEELPTQFDLFTPAKGAKDKLKVHRQAGMQAGLHGKKDTPPAGLAADENNEWLEGHREGHEARMEAIQEQMAEADALAQRQKDDLAKQAGSEGGDDDDDTVTPPPASAGEKVVPIKKGGETVQ